MFPRTPHPFLRILPAALPALLAGPSLAVSACGPAQYKCVEPPPGALGAQDAGTNVATDAGAVPPVCPPTAAIGECGAGIGPTTDASPPENCTTEAIGECGAPWAPTTAAVGEEGGTYLPPRNPDAGHWHGGSCLTRAIGECGSRITTQAVGEEGGGHILRSDAGAVFSPGPCEVKPGYSYTQACGECGSGC